MKAKDTVMKYGVMEDLCKEPDGSNNLFYTHDLHIAEAQAEISFKAGIREVVEWINENGGLFCASYQKGKWQAKLKEWGIK